MHAFSVSAAALLALAPAIVQATGQAVVKNQCSYPVYLWSVSDTVGNMITVSPNGGSYAETYRANADGGGISIKMASAQNLDGPITQFEYTLGDTLWYDISNINGYPFMESGLTAVPTEASCNAITCPAGVAACAAAYNVPSDNYATAACSPSSDIVLVLCSNQQGSGANSAASSVAASAVASSTGFDFTPISLLHAAVATSSVAPASSAAPAKSAAPATTAAPVAAPNPLGILNLGDVEGLAAVATPVPTSSADADNNVVLFTTFVTQYVTMEGRDAQPTAAPALPQHQAVRKDRRHHHHRHQAEHVLA